jgi:hypothetical protein
VSEGPDEPITIEQRFTRSALGRALISAGVAVALVFIVAINLPAGHLRVELLKPGQKVLNTFGLGQDWALFAPDPRRRTINIRAEVTLRDGTKQTWHYPRGNDLTGPYWDYRWAKWLEYMVDEANGGVLWEPAAKLIAREYGGPAKVARVQLINRTHELRPPGTGQPLRGPDQDFRFYAYAPPAPGAR